MRRAKELSHGRNRFLGRITRNLGKNVKVCYHKISAVTVWSGSCFVKGYATLNLTCISGAVIRFVQWE